MTSQMSTALGAMDLVKVNETMSNFETMFDNLDVNNEMMNQVFDNVNAGAFNEKEVNGLIGQVAEEFNMKMEEGFVDAGSQQIGNKQNVGPQQQSNNNMNV